MQRSPERIVPLDAGVMERVANLVGDLDASPEEDLGNEGLV